MSLLLLEPANKIVEETLYEKMIAEKQTSVDLICADFDGVTFHVFTSQGSKNLLNVSVSIKCWNDLVGCGADKKIQGLYSKYLQSSPESGYDVTLQVDINSVPEAERRNVAHLLATVKTYAYNAPFEYAFEQLKNGKGINSPIELAYRSRTDEKCYIKTAGNDRVMVIFTINFQDPDDTVVGEVFLKEFKKSLSGAPSVDFVHKNPPKELQGKCSGADGFVTFILSKRHGETPKKLEETATTLQTFRNYLHYHIKCSKSHLHTMMRNRVDLLLKILNRAKQQLPSEKKTASGRTFKRAGEGGRGGRGGFRGRGRGRGGFRGKR